MSGSSARGAAARTALHVSALFIWLAALAWLRPLTAPDEGRYVGVALEMLRSGDFWVPRLDGLPFFHKPPLFYWIGAVAMRVFGVSEWAGRLPSILGGTLAAGALLLFLRRWSNGRSAVMSVIVLVTMLFFYIGSQFANLDMLVAGCITATVLAVHAALLQEQTERWRGALALAFGLAGLGLLAKGLIGVVLPGAVYTIWCIVTRRWRSLRLGAWVPGWIVLTAIAGPWFVTMQMRYPDFFDYFVVTQHFRRFATAGFNNANPFWLYLPVIFGLTLPWAGWLVVLAWKQLRRSKPMPAPARSEPRPSASLRKDIDSLMAIWFVVIVIFFSLPTSKLVGYVLPALPPLAWFVARALTWVHSRRNRPRLSRPAWRWSVAAAALLCLGATAAAARFAVAPVARLSLPANLQIGAQDKVVMLDRYFYELPFYWHVRRPVLLLGDWHHMAVTGDDWHREVIDAGRFEPEVARHVLVEPKDLPELLCDAPVTWLVGESADSLRAIGLAGLHVVQVAGNDRMTVWRIDGGTGCDAPSVSVAPG